MTRRLRLRCFRPADAPALARYRSDPEVARYQTWQSPIDLAEAEAVIAGYLTEEPDGPGCFQYAIERYRRPGLIGDLSVLRESGGESATIGITLAPDVRHRGYATEAMTAVADRLFASGVRRITAFCDVRNTASAQLLVRVGFQQRGREEQYLEQRGVRADFLLFGMSGGQLRRPHEPAGNRRGSRAATERVRARSFQEDRTMADPSRPGDRIMPMDEDGLGLAAAEESGRTDGAGESEELEA